MELRLSVSWRGNSLQLQPWRTNFFLQLSAYLSLMYNDFEALQDDVSNRWTNSSSPSSYMHILIEPMNKKREQLRVNYMPKYYVMLDDNKQVDNSKGRGRGDSMRIYSDERRAQCRLRTMS